jgi:hypothetical protein
MRSVMRWRSKDATNAKIAATSSPNSAIVSTTPQFMTLAKARNGFRWFSGRITGSRPA